MRIDQLKIHQKPDRQISRDTLIQSIHATLSVVFSRGGIDGKAFIQHIPKEKCLPGFFKEQKTNVSELYF